MPYGKECIMITRVKDWVIKNPMGLLALASAIALVLTISCFDTKASALDKTNDKIISDVSSACEQVKDAAESKSRLTSAKPEVKDEQVTANLEKETKPSKESSSESAQPKTSGGTASKTSSTSFTAKVNKVDTPKTSAKSSVKREADKPSPTDGADPMPKVQNDNKDINLDEMAPEEDPEQPAQDTASVKWLPETPDGAWTEMATCCGDDGTTYTTVWVHLPSGMCEQWSCQKGRAPILENTFEE